MSVSFAAVHATPGRFTTSFDATATADGDTGGVITHNIPNIKNANDELEVGIEPLLQAPAALSAWAVTARSATTITVAKGTGAGSGNAGAQVRFVIRRRHGMVA